MDSNYKVAYNTEWSKLKKLDPLEIAKRLDVKYDDENKQFIVPFFNKDYILDIEHETIYRKDDNFVPSIDDSIIILNYLTYSSTNIEIHNKWVTLKEIPNGGVMFFPAFQNMTVKMLIKRFKDNIKEFEENALKLGGEKINFGDNAYKFKVLPKISICVV